MNGYHVFYQSKEIDGEFEEINYLVQIASILFWKKNEGKMSLYCNSEYLNFIKKWGIDDLYDEINTECLDKIQYKEYLNKYWSFCKIEAAVDIENTASQKLLLTAGYEREGILQQRVTRSNGNQIDMVMFSALNQSWVRLN